MAGKFLFFEFTHAYYSQNTSYIYEIIYNPMYHRIISSTYYILLVFSRVQNLLSGKHFKFVKVNRYIWFFLYFFFFFGLLKSSWFLIHLKITVLRGKLVDWIFSYVFLIFHHILYITLITLKAICDCLHACVF